MTVNGLKVLQDCFNPKYGSNRNNQIRFFIGSIINDKGIVQNQKKLFKTDVDKVSEANIKLIDEKYASKYKVADFAKFEFIIERGIIKEFFGTEKLVLDLPVIIGSNKKKITENVISFFIGELAKSRIIDDITFIIIKSIFRMVGVYIDIETNRVGFGNTKVKKYVYENGKRVNFSVSKITLEEVLYAEIEQGFVNELIGDKHRVFGFTHLLREYAKFRLTNWFKQVLINWNRYNVIAASRGQGKTYAASYISCRGLLDPRPGFGGRNYREIKYFVPDKENVGTQVMDYIKSLLGDLVTQKLPNGKKLFEVGKFSIRCNLTGNTFKIISLYTFGAKKELGSALGEGLACDLAVIDEACRIPDDFWTSFHQRAAFETQEFFIISTINEETPADHWFYRILVDGEVGDKQINSYRLTIEDNEIMSYNKTKEEFDIAIEKVKEELRRKGEKEFYAKGFCIILEESNVFNIGSSLVAPNENKYQDSDPRILGFDLGKLDDTAGLVIINLKHREFEMAQIVTNVSYGTQLDYAKEYKNKYPNLLVIGDRSGVGEAVSEQDITGIVDVWIKSTSAGTISFNKKDKFYTCGKGVIVNTLALALNTGILKIPYHLDDFIKQLNNFIKMKSGKSDIILYKGKGKKKDDLVLSAAYASVYAASILGLKSIKDYESYVSEIGENQTYLYNNIEDNNSTNQYDYYGTLY